MCQELGVAGVGALDGRWDALLRRKPSSGIGREHVVDHRSVHRWVPHQAARRHLIEVGRGRLWIVDLLSLRPFTLRPVLSGTAARPAVLKRCQNYALYSKHIVQMGR